MTRETPTDRQRREETGREEGGGEGERGREVRGEITVYENESDISSLPDKESARR